MALKSMQLTAEEAKDEYACCPSPDSTEGPRYPYGTQLCLGDEALAKLGMGGQLPAVGTKVMVIAEAYVSGVSMRERQGGTRTQDVDIQIVAMDVQAVTQGPNPADVLYGRKE